MLEKFVMPFCVVSLLGILAGISKGEEVVLQQGGEGPNSLFLPNPEDTILYDSPPPIIPVSPGPYWAVRFTPTGACTVKAGLVAVGAMIPSPCSLFAWNDVGGLPGPLVGGTPVVFNPIGFLTWVDLPTPFVDANDFWIGVWVDSLMGISALTDSTDNFFRSYRSADRTNWCRLDNCPPPGPWSGDLIIRAIVEYPLPANPDVAVDSILAPPDTVACLDSVPVSARVCNVGDTTVTFATSAIIQGLYGDTVTGVMLIPGACSTLTFAPWVVPDSHGTCFTVRFRTLLVGDMDTTNNRMSTVSCAWCPSNPDVAVDSIFSPQDSVNCLDTVSVSARVCNVGDTTVTFDVSATIPSLYGDTVTGVTLSPAQCTTLNFTDWVVPDTSGVCYTITFRTLLIIDTNPSNDTLSRITCVYCPEGIGENPTPLIPVHFALLQTKPNPFRTSTEIRYQLPHRAKVFLSIYDPAGRLVRTLLSGKEEEGVKSVLWDGRDDQGSRVKSGIYFYKIEMKIGGVKVFTQTRKMILLR